VDAGRAGHEAGHHGERPKGDSQQRAEYIPLHEQTSVRGLLDLSLISRRPLPQRDFLLIHSFNHLFSRPSTFYMLYGQVSSPDRCTDYSLFTSRAHRWWPARVFLSSAYRKFFHMR